MPNTRISADKRRQVIEGWLQGTSRADMESKTGVSSGSISNIISEFKKRLDDLDPEALKIFYKETKALGILPSQCASGWRIAQVIHRMGGDETGIEAFLSDLEKESLANNVLIPSIVQSLIALMGYSKNEKIPIADVPATIEKKRKELAQVRAETEAATAEKKKVLEDARMTEESVKDHNRLMRRLEKEGLNTDYVDAIVNVASNIRALGRDPRKIISLYSKFKSFEAEERKHQERCRQWEERAKMYSNSYELSNWFVLHGFMPADIELMINHVNIIAERLGIPPGKVTDRLFLVASSHITLDNKKLEIQQLDERIASLEKRQAYVLDTIPGYKYAAEVIAILRKHYGSQITMKIVEAMVKIIMSPPYTTDPARLVLDLREFQQSRTQVPTPEEETRKDEAEPAKQIEGAKGTSVQPLALPEPSTRQLERAASHSDVSEAKEAPTEPESTNERSSESADSN